MTAGRQGSSRRSETAFWKQATEQYGPRDVLAELRDRLWWVPSADGDLREDLGARPSDALRALAARIGATSLPDDDDDEQGGDDALRAAIAARVARYSLDDDDNFSEPAFNPRVKDLAPCYPEIYEPGGGAINNNNNNNNNNGGDAVAAAPGSTARTTTRRGAHE